MQRYQIVNSDVEIVKWLVDSIEKSSHMQFNRDVMECISYFFVSENLDEKAIDELIRLLNAKDRETRIVMADNFGIWDTVQAEDALISALNDSDGQVRRFALASLTLLKSVKVFEKAKSLAIIDSEEDVRRVAINYLSNVEIPSDPYSVLINALENDPAASVKVAAAEGLGYLKKFESIDHLRKWSKYFDVYVQRACAKSLCDLYEVDGVRILIESMEFPSIDSFFNYNNNVPNFISSYSNHDFDEGNRYDRDRWLK